MTTTDLYGPITDAILRLFLKYEPEAYNALADFVRRNLGIWLSSISNPKGLNFVAEDIATNAESKGYSQLLLARLQQHSPDDQPLRALVAELGLDVTAYPAVQATGLDGLQAVAANPLTRSMLEPYRRDLEQLCLNAVRIGGWKFLHDNVDHIRNKVWAPLALIAKGSPQPGQRLEVMTSANELAKHTRNITNTVDAMKLRDRDKLWVTTRLLPAQASLQKALQAWPGLDDLNEAVNRLGIVTTNDLSELNGNIKTVAASIDGLNLTDKLESLQATIAAGMADAGAAEQTKAEIRSMDQQVLQLLDLVDRHDPWQLLKDAFDNYIDLKTLADAQNGWGRVNSRIDALIELPNDLGVTRTAMAEALATGDFDDAVLSAIIALNSVIASHFLSVDGNLLIAADDLGKMGAALGQVLEKFDG